MVELINEWDLIEKYCQTQNKTLVYFRNLSIKSVDEAKREQIWKWYEEFTDDSVLDAMKTMGTWDMIVLNNVDAAIAYASSWFPPKKYCPDEDYYWECHVIGPDGDFEWKNVDPLRD